MCVWNELRVYQAMRSLWIVPAWPAWLLSNPLPRVPRVGASERSRPRFVPWMDVAELTTSRETVREICRGITRLLDTKVFSVILWASLQERGTKSASVVLEDLEPRTR